MEITFGKIFGLLIALVYVLAAIVSAGWANGLRICMVLLLPLILIWFPDECGRFTGYLGRGGPIDQESPPILVSAMGWFFLVGFPMLLWFIWR